MKIDNYGVSSSFPGAAAAAGAAAGAAGGGAGAAGGGGPPYISVKVQPFLGHGCL